MYVVTFYSFKGGVGRSMGLMNVALDLVLSGGRVLVVDFDLEAPGLETFNLPRSERLPTKGVVDFILTYSAEGKAPDVKDFLYRSVIPDTKGELWVMPAGVQDDQYSARFNSIDWQELYAQQQGYLLLEDLKEQWKRHLDPDYVLIDSRTGYTDVSGICTRQLPDAVACFFFPTEQNLQGLEDVVKKIRKEKETGRGKEIQLIFVNSNVPDIDDEERQLEGRLKRFRDQLGYSDVSATIHRYDNAALFNQVIFTWKRPRTRLAAEYSCLVKEIRRLNPEDRIGALDYLGRFGRGSASKHTRGELNDEPEGIEGRLQRIYDAHRDDGEVLERLAIIRRRQGRLEESEVLLAEAIAAGNDNARVHLSRADVAQRLGDSELAIESIRCALTDHSASLYNVSWAVRWLRDLDPGQLLEIANAPAVQALEDQELTALCYEFLSKDLSSLVAGETILRYRLGRTATLELRSALGLNLLGQGKFAEVLGLIESDEFSPKGMEQSSAFNLAMATWAASGKPQTELFARVLDLHDERKRSSQAANYAQCLSVANWAVGNRDDALIWLLKARQRIMSRRTPELSCWRYRVVEPNTFLEDLDDIERLIEGTELTPAFMKRAISVHSGDDDA